MASWLRKSLMAGAMLTIGFGAGAAWAQMTSVVTRPDGTTIETSVISPTSIKVTISGGPDFQQPMVVNYTNISYSASEIVYQGTYTYKGVTEAINCRVNTATQAVSGSGACNSALGGGSSGTSTGTTTTTGTGGTTTTTGTTTTGTTTTTLTDGTTATTTINLTTPAEHSRAWVRSGALSALLPGQGVTKALETLANIQSPSLDYVFDAFATLTTDAQRAAAVRQLQPATPSAAPANAVATAKAVATTVLGRALAVRGGAGVSTGDLTDGLGMWIQPFGYRAVQGARDGQDGYTDRTLGVALGADAKVADQVRVGLALTYAASQIDGRDASIGDDTDVKSGYVSLYSQYETKALYVVGQLTAGFSGYDGHRYISATNQHAESDYRGWQVGARVDAGMPVALGGGWLATPMAGLAYIHSRTNSYTETGAGALSLSVEGESNNALIGSLGGRLAYEKTSDGVTWTPYLQALANYDFVGTRSSSTARFSPAGSTPFVTEGADPARFGADLTAGLDIVTAGALTLNVAYTYGLRDDFHAHGGSLRARFQY